MQADSPKCEKFQTCIQTSSFTFQTNFRVRRHEHYRKICGYDLAFIWGKNLLEKQISDVTRYNNALREGTLIYILSLFEINKYNIDKYIQT